MEFTRKSFLSGAAIGLAGLTFFPAEAFGADLSGSTRGAVSLRSAVGQTFYAQGGKGVVVPLVLDLSVDAGSNALTEQFSLYFRADGKYSLTEGTWHLAPPKGGAGYDVFLVPAGTGGKRGALYRADFCILRAAG
jgi:hypothetical protein